MNVHITYCLKPKSIHEFYYQAANSIHYVIDVSRFAFCVDIGAPKFLRGQRTKDQLLHRLGCRAFPKYRSNGSLLFGDATVKSCCSICLYLETPPPMLYIPILFEVVPVYVLVLVGLDVLDAHQLFADTVHN